MNKVVEYIIGAKDATGNAVRSALARLKSFASSVGSNLQNIRAGIGMFRTAMSNVMSVMQKPFAFEKMTVQFKTLIGSMDEARDHMRMLQELGNTPPFSLEEFAAASRSMMVMTDGVLGFKRSLELVGDAAAATGQPIQNLAHEVGRAFAIIRDGQPLTRATMGLRNMGAITPEVAAKLDELQKAGASTSEIWNTLEEHLRRFEGAMKETEETGDGLMGAIKSQWDTSLRTIGAAFLVTAKDCMSAVLEKMKQINEDGSIEVWSDSTIGFLKDVAEAAKATASALQWLWEKTGASDVWNVSKGTIQSVGYAATRTIAGMVNGESFMDAISAANREGGDVFAKNVANGYWLGQAAEKGWLGKGMKWAANDNKSDREDEERRKGEIRERAVKRRMEERAKAEAEATKKAADEEAKKQAALAEGQRKIEAKTAKEKEDYQKKLAADIEAAQIAAEEKAALAALNAADKIAQKRAQLAKEYADSLLTVTDKEQKAQLDAANTVATKRLDMEKTIADEVSRIRKAQLSKDADALQKELSDWKEISADAKTRLSEAQQAEKQAWGWYRDRDSWTAQLAEERADAEAQKQFDKDFARLKDRYRDWRTSDRLSDDDELIRRVALAREEKAAAEQYARETAEATQACADALEAIQAAIETEES